MVLVSAGILFYMLRVKKTDGSALYVRRRAAADAEGERPSDDTPAQEHE